MPGPQLSHTVRRTVFSIWGWDMRKTLDTVAAGVLVAGFAYVCYGALVVEPGMGFRTPADYVNPALILAATRTTLWYIGEIVYIAIGVSCVYLAGRFTDRYAWVAGTVAGIGFAFIGILDRVFLDLPTWLGDEQQTTVSVLGFIPLRLAVLRMAAGSFGVFAWRVSMATSIRGRWYTLWRVLGYVMLVAGIVFVFVFIPMILLTSFGALALCCHSIWAVDGRPRNTKHETHERDGMATRQHPGGTRE